ncbi:MAG TPA: hypothetical protein VK453_17725 [Micromonosporaceae bacterium]|nr:hypothetical protein [Micromonosporaceae bacterium]
MRATRPDKIIVGEIPDTTMTSNLTPIQLMGIEWVRFESVVHHLARSGVELIDIGVHR